MTSVTLTRDKEGCILSCKASGHALYKDAGRDIVCAALSVLMRTSLAVLNATRGVKVKAEADKRGELYFYVERGMKSVTGEGIERLICVADFLESGVESLAREYPKNVKLISCVGCIEGE